jgi:hypothetical protein
MKTVYACSQEEKKGIRIQFLSLFSNNTQIIPMRIPIGQRHSGIMGGWLSVERYSLIKISYF